MLQGLGKSIYLVAGVVFFLVVFYELYNKRKERVLNLPPGPFLWPKLGSLPQLLMQGTRQSFRTRMSALAQKYGTFAVSAGWLGSIRACVKWRGGQRG